jgi:hypothetical protein
MTDEHRPRPHWTDERLNDKFAGIERSIEDSRKQNAKDNAALKADFDEKHKVNQADIARLREGQGMMQSTLSSINEKTGKSLLLLTQAVDKDGEPGQGRLGAAEQAIEVLKKFRWQLIAGLSVVVTLLKILKVI